MRIISGKYRSRIINAPDGVNTRPTSDKARESIFNVLAFYLNDSNVLDIFAGSGALGIEALSRGAKKATFIDIDSSAINCLKSNLRNLKIDNCCVLQNDYTILNEFKNEKFDIILLDPPYALKVFDEILSLIESNDLLSKNGVIVYESNQENSLKNEVKGYTLKVKKYGIAYVNFLYKK